MRTNPDSPPLTPAALCPYCRDFQDRPENVIHRDIGSASGPRIPQTSPVLPLVSCAKLVFLALALAVVLPWPVSAQEAELGPPPEAPKRVQDQPWLRWARPSEVTSSDWLDTQDRAAVRDSYFNVYLAAANKSLAWTGNTNTCNAGTTSQEYRNAVAQRLNWFRSMAGVPVGVSLDPLFSAKDQQAALMISVNRQLSHSPPTSWTCYTADGAQAAGNSNICYSTGATHLESNPGCVRLYILDSGSNNTAVGHRRWIFYPQTQAMGTGDVPGDGTYYSANALWIFDGNFGNLRPATRNTFVAWPPNGFVPAPVVYPRWSFSYPDASFTAATVTMQCNGSSLPLQQLPVHDGYGENTIVWEPNVCSPFAGADAVAAVSISNVIIGGNPQTFAYTVRIFDPASYTIGGTVTTGGVGLEGVTVTLSGSQSGTATTNAAGAYSFTGLTAGANYTVTPMLANHTFTPPGRTFNNLQSDQTANFTAALNTYTISGQLTKSGAGLAGVTVTLTGGPGGTRTSDASGNYSFTSLPGGGNYVVTPSLANHTFTPPYATFNSLQTSQTANFVATLITFTVSGQVTKAGAGLSGVTLALTGTAGGTRTTDASGNYSFPALAAGGNYTVTPTLANHTFTPPSTTFNSLQANQVVNFTATTATYTISGQVTKAGAGLSGVSVALTGTASSTRTTDASGSYSFTSLAAGGNYTVTPSLANHTFTPPSAVFSNMQTNQTVNFGAQTVSNSPPIVAGATPAAGATATQAFTFSFSDPDGWQDLGVVNILVNFWLDGRNSCYLAYSRPANTFYLINNTGDGYAGSMPLNGSGTLGNSQCVISGAGSSVSGAGNTMNLTLNMTFPASFAGAKVMYLAARDLVENNSGWQRMGVWKVPGAAQSTTTAVAGMNPARGSGTASTFAFTFTDTNGANDLGVMNILVNDWLDGRHACYLAYARANNTLYLMNDNGDGLLPGKVLNGSGSLGNSQCTVNGAGSSATPGGNTLTLTLNMTFDAGFAGNRVLYLAARDVNELNNTGWQAMGSWTVQ